MPCEGCSVQFTVFKRKRLCYECRRFYCNHCLLKKNEKILCERCIVLTARPLSKIDLLKLKPKDLIFYLQSKHISTTGCVEKEELVNLILTHVHNSIDSGQSTYENASHSSFENAQNDNFENCSNPFDQIKQTCQSLFSSFAEKINDFNLENKATSPSSNRANNVATNQPRVHTREMPTYASSAQSPHWSPPSNAPNSDSIPRSSSSTSATDNTNRPIIQSPSPSNPSSPAISLSSISSHSSRSQPHTAANARYDDNNIPTVHRNNIRRLTDNIQDVNTNVCDCSDDELLTAFNSQRAMRSTDSNQMSVNNYAEKLSPPSQTDSAFEDQIPGPSGCASGAQSVSPSKISSGELQKSSEGSESGSSFEELGAMGGGTGDWQIINKVDVQCLPTASANIQTNRSGIPSTSSMITAFHAAHSSGMEFNNDAARNLQKQRRINRRRSDGSLLQSSHNRDESLLMEDESDEIDDRENVSCKRVRKCCNKCGKTKNTLKQLLLKLHRQLENAQMSEAEIKQEIEEFLRFLERRSKDSFDCSDGESTIEGAVEQAIGSTRVNLTRTVSSNFANADDGIHVYPHQDEDTGSWRNDGRFLNLGDFKSSSEFDDLSVKQLKEILMLNRVDFKGCCEKQELLDRVNRLWNDLQSSPAIDKLQTDDLCKICMDAPIECVILECGHMATCTNCGKVLSECPICRQYIVRVVRFFRA